MTSSPKGEHTLPACPGAHPAQRSAHPGARQRSLTSKSFLSKLLLALLLTTPFLAFALIDEDEDGMSDLWEQQYGLSPEDDGTLHPDESPLADPDGDGWNNLKESIAGTDPFHGDPPDGFLQATITPNPALAGVFTVKWPSLPGKLYTLHVSPNLTALSWTPVGDPILADEQPIEIAIASDPQTAPKLFWRVSVEDIDQDNDGLNDHEEWQVGTDPTLADSDGDGIPDEVELTNGTNPNNPDTDGDGIDDGGDSDPQTPHGPPPSLAASNASGNPTVNLIAGK
jgi:hypothetical protein